MIGHWLLNIDLALCRELALVLFFAIFVVISVRTLRMNRGTLEQHTRQALNDAQESAE